MALTDITDDSFREIYTNNEIVVVDFWAPWCAPCHQFVPIFEKVSESYPDIVFGKINTEFEQKVAQYFGVRSIPTVIILRNELELFRSAGSMSEDDLRKVVDKIKSADMELVEKELSDEEQ